MRRFLMGMTLLAWCGMMTLPASPAAAADLDTLKKVLESVDQVVCKKPKDIARFYGKDLVIMSDAKRIKLEDRIADYEHMIASYEEMKCDFTRKVLGGKMDGNLGYLMMDEVISVKSRLSTDERQHSFCSYVLNRNGGAWQIVLEQCASLPDYNIRPGEDALYYFHNPVY